MPPAGAGGLVSPGEVLALDAGRLRAVQVKCKCGKVHTVTPAAVIGEGVEPGGGVGEAKGLPGLFSVGAVAVEAVTKTRGGVMSRRTKLWVSMWPIVRASEMPPTTRRRRQIVGRTVPR